MGSSTNDRLIRLVVALIFLALLTLSGYQFAEIRRMRFENQIDRNVAHGAVQGLLNLEMRHAWGCYLTAIGGNKGFGDYEFDGDIRVDTGLHWCQFKTTENSDISQCTMLMNKIVPAIVPGGSSHLVDRIDKEWSRILASGHGETTETRESFSEPPDIVVDMVRIADRGYIMIKTGPGQTSNNGRRSDEH